MKVKFFLRVLLIAVIFVMAIYVGTLAGGNPGGKPLTYSLPQKIAWVFGVIFLVGPLLYLAIIAICRWFFYNEQEPPADDTVLPFCSVVVPAYNEGSHIYETLKSLLDSDYPKDKLEIIAVNDGSIDDTADWMKKGAALAPEVIKTIDCLKNGGKRHALYAGFNAACGDVIVTIDSDCIVEKQTLRYLVAPFLNNKEIGAVAGNVLVQNVKNGIMPAMLATSFTFSFDFMSCGQSACDGVIRTPGAVSAFRADAIQKIKERWINQTFWGRPADIGDDFALTTLTIEMGYHVRVQRSARISTKVPETYAAVSKMLLRWHRGNLRECFRMFGFIFKNFKICEARSWFLLFTLLVLTQGMLIPTITFGFLIYFIVASKGTILFGTLGGALMYATLPAIVNLQHNSTRRIFQSYLYCLFYTFTLFWLVPFATLTVNNSGWLTRQHANSGGKL